jgi:hypothetical protein
MGLQVSKLDKYGVMHDEAYLKVIFFAFDLAQRQARFVLACYHSFLVKQAGKLPIPGEEVEIIITAQTPEQSTQFDLIITAIDSHGPLKVAYVLAKRVPELMTAVDILDEGQVALTEADIGLA